MGKLDELSFLAEPHGNCKSGSLFYPVKKSTMGSIKIKVSENKLRKRTIYKEMSHVANFDYGYAPRSLKQIYNVGHNLKPQNELESILAFNEELDKDEIIWFHSDIPNDVWVLGRNHMITGMRHGSLLHPLSVDPTFNHGEFEVTPFTFRSHIFDSKSKNITAKYIKVTLPGPVVLHHGKKENIFTLAFKVIAEKTGLTDTVFGIITDGELAVQNTCSTNFKNSLLLRCANHFKENCKRFLLSAGVPNNDLHVFLEVVFGEEGLLEAEDKKDLKRRIKTAEDFLMGIGECSLKLHSGKML